MARNQNAGQERKALLTNSTAVLLQVTSKHNEHQQKHVLDTHQLMKRNTQCHNKDHVSQMGASNNNTAVQWLAPEQMHTCSMTMQDLIARRKALCSKAGLD